MEGILGNDFAMPHELTVQPCEGAVYLPNLSRAREEHMGQRLPCTIRSVTEVWTITEETLAVWAVGQAMPEPHTVTQVPVVVPTPRARGTVMIEMGPGPLGLCCGLRSGRSRAGQQDLVSQHRTATNPGDGQNDGDEVNRLVEREERQLMEDMLAIGIIQESNSAWSSPTVLVKKKDGTTRFCINYRRLNQVTKVDAYPLPHIEDSFNTLGGARFFCSLDLASRNWQVEMDTADQEETAFVMQGELYEFRVMPFGLVTLPLRS